MANFVNTIKNIFKIEELRQRILYTLGILIIVRLGAHITLPGIDVHALAISNQDAASNTLFGLFDLFVGGAFSNAAIFALGIMPYITSSIIFQLAGVVIPEIQKMQREGEEGRRKINQYTRLGTVVISALQGWGLSIKLAYQQTAGGVPVVPDSGFLFTISTIFLLTAGTVFMMWLGEQITERGIGNGISLIIFIGIIARLPASLWQEWLLIQAGSRHWLVELVVITLLVFIIAAVVLVTQGARRIPVQYAKRQVGRKVYGGTTQYIPLRVNTAGVMPIIFAQALMFIPNTILSFFPESKFIITLAQLFHYDSFVYAILYFTLIVLFTYFYTAIIFNPKDIADNMKKQGGFIPGIRPGQHTVEYIDSILTRITLPGSIFLGLVAILPTFVTNIFNISMGFAQFFGGTSLLIVVGVALDTLQQIESHLLMRHYDGFMKSGRIRGRVGAGGF
ncbi:MAG TPA: preprotein translocase subunit SecY [Candidatus Kapabacteria bacterium]|jgi:preprotein translocase subunit SecY|nr:preprotein translocase subunit SecY [Candidatus Kapabacteria bacterium]HOM05493.1 preprotein translocase subunit SecY [Candidatus Kapabacteria bacterium]HPU22683.1 preprotein translocase subunit SecY [Candidatus Kapabacteria bacterium]